MIHDDALMAFVAWCRMNAWQYTSDPDLVRRVFNAYAALPPLEPRLSTTPNDDPVTVRYVSGAGGSSSG